MKKPHRPFFEVGAAVVVHGSRVLLAKRTGGDLDGLWEFPGGKLENGESAAQAVIRELVEELDLEVIPRERLLVLEHAYPDKDIRLHFVRCELAVSPDGALPPTPADHAAWFFPREFPLSDFCPADRLAAGNIRWQALISQQELLMSEPPRLLVINPGSTTTKIALYEGEKIREVHELEHDRTELAKYPTTLSQLEYRRDALLKALEFWKVPITSLSAVISRGCPLKPLESGVYSINDDMLSDIRSGKLQDHASHLGALLAHEIGEQAKIPSFIADPVSVDEFDDVARISGWPDLPRGTLSHALNIKAMLREAAMERGVEPETLNAVVAHLGGGFSITAIRQGRIIDVNNANDGGPFSPERAGTLPLVGLLKICFSGKYTYDQLRKMLIGKGGLMAHLGTADVREVVKRIEAGDEKARLVLEAMCYQISKEIGAMAAALCGKVDMIILTGGIAYSSFVVDYVRERTDFIAPLIIKPGQNELKALAEHALRALKNPAVIRTY